MEYVRYCCVGESFSMELGSAHIVVVFASCHGRGELLCPLPIHWHMVCCPHCGVERNIERQRSSPGAERAPRPLYRSLLIVVSLRKTALASSYRTAPQFQNRGHHAITPPLTVAQAGNGCVSMSLESSSNSRILIWRIDVWTLVVAVHK